MADEQQTPAAAEDATAPRKKKLMLIVAIVAVLLLGGGGTTYFLLASDGEAAAGEAVAEGDGEGAEAALAPAIYLQFEPAFLANFTVKGRMRYLQLSVAAMTRDQAVIDTLQAHMPLVRNRIVMLLGSQDFDALQTAEGRQQLQGAMLTAVQEVVEAELGRPGVEQLFFTNYVMQ